MGRAKRVHQGECSTSGSKVPRIEENQSKVLQPTRPIVGDVTPTLDIVNGGQSLYQRRRRARGLVLKFLVYDLYILIFFFCCFIYC